MAAHDPWVLGIDLGTTNTAAVVCAPDRPGPISILHGSNAPVMPSVVSFKNPEMPLVGWLAKDLMLTDPETTIHGWKRFIGRPERSEFVSRYRDRFPFRIQATPGGALGAVVHGQIVPFVDVAALVLDQVRQQTAAALRHDVRDAVIAVPAHFAAAQRDAVRQAGARAGLNILGLVNEPTAAALAFGAGRRLDSRVLIYDLGGGTFDSTILELVDDIFDVKATRGDGFLGGIDLDRAVTARLADVCREQHDLDVRDQPVLMQRLLSAAENTKCALSTEPAVRVQVPRIGQDRRGRSLDLDYRLTREELEHLTAPLIERTIGIIEEMMQATGYRRGDIDNIVLVGGQTRMPMIRKRINEIFGRAPLAHLDPDTCVAHGAAMVARGRTDPGGAVLLDVLSVPIGLVLPGGLTRFVFEANRSLPAHAHVALERPAAARGELVIGLWQGPDVAAAERQLLGVLRIPESLFAVGAGFALDMMLAEDLTLRAVFSSTAMHVPLALQGAPGG